MFQNLFNEKFDEVDDKWIGFWRNAVWVSSGWLWWVWLSHDVANIAVYLPRQLRCNITVNCFGLFYSSCFFTSSTLNGGTDPKSCFG